MKEHTAIRLGTSALTAAGWPGTFYPKGLPTGQYLSHYALHFDTVEVDSTFYRIPSDLTVRNWYARTPKGFLFATKAPQTITHERVLVDCENEIKMFLTAMGALGEKIGPILFQFSYFNRVAFSTVEDFLERLAPFFARLPQDQRFAVEIRNKSWLGPRLYDVLRKHKAALALIDHPWMPGPRSG